MLRLRRPGDAGLLAEPPTPRVGLRLAYLATEPVDDPFAPGNHAARVVKSDDTYATFELDPCPVSGLQYLVHASLARTRPVLHIKLELVNRMDTPRTCAVWALASFPRAGVMLAPYGDAPRSRRRLVLPFWSRLPQPGVTHGFDAMRIDLDAPLRGRAFKVGLVSDAGWAAYLRGEQAILMHAARRAGMAYPEGDANVTLFQQDADGETWAEAEQVGPWSRLAPGEAATLELSLSLSKLREVPSDSDELRRTLLNAFEGY